ncbi:protein IQ-DOMAIN 11-like isoform X2 [Rutidosis leptorrhynchoides]|uniref:protein IQ-DOMAIN 11-like isoform X2 n=1 Tax=Rutidosis leptorrhynchoides TaxID=125765 RepID=UPI003A990651
MAKRRWLGFIKRFFITETCQNKDKKRRWVFGRHKLKRLTSQSAIIERPKSAEKKVKPESVHVDQEVDEHKQVSCSNIQSSSSFESDNERENNAATTIQTAFRGLLARKALRALKGLVRLQAIIRGHLVRRQAVTTLKYLQSVVNIQSQACAKRVQVALFTSHNNFLEKRRSDIKIDMNSQKRWDDTILTKEEENAMLYNKREAAMKRERIKEYALNHRLSSESEQSKVNGKWRYWLEHWVDTELAKRDDLQNIRTKEEFESQKVKLRNLKEKNTSSYLPRTTRHRKQRSIGDEHSISTMDSPVCPTYMAATQSAKARSRSLSSPRLRPISAETWSATNSPYKQKLLSPISSINSDASSSQVWNVNGRGGFSQRSPSLKGVPGHVRSNRTSKHHSFT